MNWNEVKDFTETNIRGKVITMAVDIEHTLLAIIIYSAPDPYNSVRKFRRMTMGDKIKATIEDLKKYKPEYFEQYKEELDKLTEFNKVRNDMAHQIMRFPIEDNPNLMRIHFVGIHEGREMFHYRDYTTDYLQDYVIRCKNLNGVLARLADSLKEDFLSNQKT